MGSSFLPSHTLPCFPVLQRWYPFTTSHLVEFLCYYSFRSKHLLQLSSWLVSEKLLYAGIDFIAHKIVCISVMNPCGTGKWVVLFPKLMILYDIWQYVVGAMNLILIPLLLSHSFGHPVTILRAPCFHVKVVKRIRWHKHSLMMFRSLNNCVTLTFGTVASRKMSVNEGSYLSCVLACKSSPGTS